MAETAATTAKARTTRKILAGIVVSNAMKDTIAVEVTRYVRHPKYKKYVKHSKKYLAHDPGNTKTVGEKVRIEECRPISRRKRFTVVANV